MSGRLITLEGIDGTGKTTLLQLLSAKLQSEGYTILETKEPGSPLNQLGLELRQILFHTVTTKNMARGVADCLFLADHIQHVETIIKPALASGRTILCDRYSDSEFAYAVAKNTPGTLLEAYTAFFGPIPDITILLVATDPGKMLERARARRGETHQIGKTWDDVNQQIAIQQEYLNRLVGQERTIVINVSPEQRADEVFQNVWDAVSFALVSPRSYESVGEIGGQG